MSRLLPHEWLGADAASVAQLAPVQWLNWPLLSHYGLVLGVKREDLLDPRLGGNKFYKLHQHLRIARAEGHSHVLSFGGAWSNHLYALAAAGDELGIRTTGVVRGERPHRLSAMLQDAADMGMRLHFVSRSEYREKQSPAFMKKLLDTFGPFYGIPEGAGDLVGAQGCYALGQGLAKLRQQQPFDVVCSAVGTGSTLAGLAAGLPQNVRVCGFSALKGPGCLADDIDRLTKQLSGAEPAARWCLEVDYHGGGYGRLQEPLAQFMHQFEQQTGVLLDPVYTAKMMWGIAEKARQGHWQPGIRLLALHSGGLQGRRGFQRLR